MKEHKVACRYLQWNSTHVSRGQTREQSENKHELNSDDYTHTPSPMSPLLGLGGGECKAVRSQERDIIITEIDSSTMHLLLSAQINP